jgi:hypothetical protein
VLRRFGGTFGAATERPAARARTADPYPAEQQDEYINAVRDEAGPRSDRHFRGAPPSGARGAAQAIALRRTVELWTTCRFAEVARRTTQPAEDAPSFPAPRNCL